MTTSRVRDLFDLPSQIRKGDFVVKLAETVSRPEETAETFVVTPALRDAFDRALGLVGSSLRDKRSQAAYLHGSFGSGKSHFMALLSLLLDGHEAAWRVPELHPLRDKHRFAGERRLLQLHFHMVGQASIEAAVFSKYLDFLRQHHPDAPVPALFADEELFADARQLLEKMGDEAFFEPMNADAPKAAGWGKLEAAGRWDRARFDRAAASVEPREREELFSALAKTWFKAFTRDSGAFIDLDNGLGVLSRHAAFLGYEGVVLFLDELILWLAARASDAAWLHQEAQKMVKLVEAQEADRPIPLVSFIARQRDLADMVGEDYAGAENMRLRESLQWWEGRYDTIKLEDRNLPDIVERRVLRPRDEAARAALDEAFDKMRRSAGASWQAMLGQQDAAAFRKVYPFSPALVEALVALSNSLQRERTAIKLLMEILVEHIEDLEVGEVVRVGDLFDVLAGGEDATDGVMKARFDSAKHLYRHHFLPIIQSKHGTNTPERCQRLRPGHALRIGCSNCAERGCRTDNRLVKTLLIAALVPAVESLKDLTAGRLVQLNHGTLRVPVPGTEAQQVAAKLREWASAIGQLRVGNEPDPRVSVRLEGVDLEPLLRQFGNADTDGARQRVLRDLLFDAMGVDKVVDAGRDHSVTWRGTKRMGHLLFANVRMLGPEKLACPDEHSFRLVVDYPFDKEGFGPNDDLEVIERFMEATDGSWTLVWLPSFFSAESNKLLGELTILEHIFASKETQRQCVANLGVEQQARALTDLDNLRSSKKARLMRVLEQAYGLATEKPGDLDPAASVDKHLVILKPGARIPPTIAPNLADALDRYVPELLAARYPRHPNFTKTLSRQRVEKLVERFGQIVDSDDKRIPAPPDEVKELGGTLGELGLVRVTEGAVHLLPDRLLQDLEKKRNQQGAEQPEVHQLRRWIDEDGKMGLTADAEDLVIRCYARWAARTFVQGGVPYQPRAGYPIADDVVLEKPDLPPHADWQKALQLAGPTFGITLPGKALHADNLKRFEAELKKRLEAAAGPSARLPGALAQRLAAFGLDDSVDRMRTARSADALCASLRGKGPVAQVVFLAGFAPETSARAVGESIAHAADNARVLDDDLVFGPFEQVRGRLGELVGGEELLDRVAQALRQDELNQSLAARLRDLAVEAQRLLQPGSPPPPPGWHTVFDEPVRSEGRDAVRTKLRDVVAALEAALERSGDEVRLEGKLTLRVRKKS